MSFTYASPVPCWQVVSEGDRLGCAPSLRAAAAAAAMWWAEEEAAGAVSVVPCLVRAVRPCLVLFCGVCDAWWGDASGPRHAVSSDELMVGAAGDDWVGDVCPSCQPPLSPKSMTVR